MQRWVSAVALAAALAVLCGIHTTEAILMTLNLLNNPIYPEAACLDGSPPAYYFHAASDSTKANKV